MTRPTPPTRSYPFHRCAECGSARPSTVFRGDRERSVMACPDHPGAEAIAWTRSLQSLLYLFDQRVSAGERLQSLRAEVEENAASRPDAVATLVLFERWGGMPERRPRSTRPVAATPAGLYG